MRATVVPAVKGKWEVREIPRPDIGPNQVLIQIKASGLCYTDVHITNGALPTKFPRVLGHEPVGEIVAVGSAVTTRRVGDRVGVPWVQSTCGRCEWCLRGKGLFCPEQIGTGVDSPGSHAEFMPAFAQATVLIPDGVAYEQAAPIFCAGYTVWSGLRIAEPKPHEKVAVVGVGGLGHLAVQYAKAAGFETLAVSHSPDKTKLIKDLGADVVVSDGEGLSRAGGADVILATGNSWKAAQDAMKGLRPDGRLVLMGLSDETFSLTAGALMNRHRIIGSLQNDVEYLYEALDFVARGKVKVVTEIYPLKDIARAYDRVSRGEVRFRAVIVP
ncbi:MAG TPA: alcohol dehydrogenase catalytic domain-containing protein [Elusimicrobiota bacterium]|nr:alcohol dehydrogenase catalytic domain-containing protein [Elusimicrobiota bacterium]HNI57032.1 alcohol dehydrogenase catalytic domain-containing protein [Elusimicrobiota bacterium]